MQIGVRARRQCLTVVYFAYAFTGLFALAACGMIDRGIRIGAPPLDRVEPTNQPETPQPSLTPPVQVLDQAITSYAVASDGALWYAFDTFDGGGASPPGSQHYGLYRSLNGQVSHWPVPGIIRAIKEAPDGSLYVLAGWGVLRYADGALETLIDLKYGSDAFDRAFLPISLDFTPDGDVWIGGVHSLVRFDGNTWTQYEVNVRRLLIAPDGSVWGQGWDGRSGSDCCFVHVTGDAWVTYPHSAELPVSAELLDDIQGLRR